MGDRNRQSFLLGLQWTCDYKGKFEELRVITVFTTLIIYTTLTLSYKPIFGWSWSNLLWPFFLFSNRRSSCWACGAWCSKENSCTCSWCMAWWLCVGKRTVTSNSSMWEFRKHVYGWRKLGQNLCLWVCSQYLRMQAMWGLSFQILQEIQNI